VQIRLLSSLAPSKGSSVRDGAQCVRVICTTRGNVRVCTRGKTNMVVKIVGRRRAPPLNSEDNSKNNL